MKEWFINYDKKGFGLKSDETGEDEAQFIKRALHLRKGCSVLDAPCGAGRVSVHLAKAGCRITGIDLTEAYIKRACQRFKQEGLKGDFHVMDLQLIDFKEMFDAIFNWQGSFGFFSEDENFEVLRRYTDALRPGGRLLIDQPNREYLLRHFRNKIKNDVITIENLWNKQSQRIESKRIIKRNGKKDQGCP